MRNDIMELPVTCLKKNLKPIYLYSGSESYTRVDVAFSAPLASKSAALPLVRCYSFVVPEGLWLS